MSKYLPSYCILLFASWLATARAEPYQLWTGAALPADPTKLPEVANADHRTIHQPTPDGHKFLHGAAIIHYRGALYAHWANSPVDENSQAETLQGRRSTDNGKTWSEVEMIGPGFDGPECHSHGVFLVHKDRLWTFGARFGKGEPAKHFRGLRTEAFLLSGNGEQWESQGIVMQNCWPYDEPALMDNGSYITGGQDKDGLPVVAISRGKDVTQWDTIAIPYDPQLEPNFAETTIWAEKNQVFAVIRGGKNVAWVATSDDFGRNWTTARASNLPMPRSKAYLGRLSTGQLYLLSNYQDRDTLVISVGEPGAWTFNRMMRIRHGKSEPPRFPGFAKGKQWSYPYAHEHDGNLYVVYSIGKEDCGLSVLPLASLAQE